MATESLLRFENLEIETLDDNELSISFDLKSTEANEENQYFEFYVQFLRDGRVVRNTQQNVERLIVVKKVLTYGFQRALWKKKPDSFQLFYRSFQLENIEIQLEHPPELNKKSGSFTLCSPQKGMLGGGHGRQKTTEVESIVLRLQGQELNYSLNLRNTKPYDTFGSNGLQWAG